MQNYCSVKYGQPGRLTLKTLTSCFCRSMGAVIRPQACTHEPSALQNIKLKTNMNTTTCFLHLISRNYLLISYGFTISNPFHTLKSIDNCQYMSTFVYKIDN